MIFEQAKTWIDNASYRQLLQRWRFAPIGDLFFQGEIGDYYVKIIKKRKKYQYYWLHIIWMKLKGYAILF